MTSTLPIPGFHYGLPYEEYSKWDAINFSRLKPIRDTASKCRYEMDNPKKPTPAMILGSALHVATLEPARFEQLFHTCPPCDRRTKEGKEFYAEQEKAAGSKLLIRDGSSEDEGNLSAVKNLRGMAKAIRSMKSAAPFLNGQGQNEVSALWKDGETGLMCKARIDRFIDELALFRGMPAIVEIKTTQDASEWEFSKTVDKLYYDAQAACYCIAVKAITGKTPQHVFLACESFPPFDAQTYFTDEQNIQIGHRKYRQMLNRYAECVKSGKWPGYKDVYIALGPTKYANERSYED